MKPSKAAIQIGCSIQHVRRLIRDRNLQATKNPTDDNQHGYVYDIPDSEVIRYSKTTHGNRGRKK